MTQTAQAPVQSGQKTTKSSSTQKFTQIRDIQGDVVFLADGGACTIIEVQSTNFALLSKDEQDAKLYSYASLINSLSFPIQIVVRNKRMDISAYIKSLEDHAQKVSFGLSLSSEQTEKISSHILRYRDFVSDLTRVNVVLDKRFYLVVPFTSLEEGAAKSIKGGDMTGSAIANLKIKRDSLLSEIQKIGLHAKVLQKDDLIALFYELFNSQTPLTPSATLGGPIVSEGGKK